MSTKFARRLPPSNIQILTRAACSIAALQPSGFIPPAFVITFIFFAIISYKTYQQLAFFLITHFYNKEDGNIKRTFIRGCQTILTNSAMYPPSPEPPRANPDACIIMHKKKHVQSDHEQKF